MAKISELPILTEPDTPTRFLAVDVSTSPYSSKTVTLAGLRNKIVSLGVIDIGPTLVQNLNGSFDVANPVPTQTGHGGAFLTTDGSLLSWATLNSTFPSQTGNTGKYLTTDGTNVSWATVEKIPEQVNRAGQYLTTNGTTASWVAIGASLLASQTGNASALLTTNGTTSSWVKLGASLLATQTGNAGKLLTTNGTTSSWVSLSLTLSSLTNVSLSSPTTGQVLTYNGTNWVNSTTVSGGASGVTSIAAGTGTAVSASTGSITIWSTAGSGLSSRATFSTSTTSIIYGSSVSTTIVNAYKGYALLGIQVSAGAWVTIYSNAASQTADSSRTITTDPTPGSGIIAESISMTPGTTSFTPAIVGYNNEASPTTNIPVKIYNNSGATNTITVTLTLIKLEA
jgi:hypothetical protein